jgi:hypothetical protein
LRFSVRGQAGRQGQRRADFVSFVQQRWLRHPPSPIAAASFAVKRLRFACAI